MKAVFFQQYGHTDVLEFGTQPIPNPTAKEVLIKVHAAALNPIDSEVRRGAFKLVTGKRFPKIPACDFAGEVIALGAKVKQFAVGDHVYGMSKTYRGGALAEYLTMPAAEIGLKPPALTMCEAAALPLASLTALQALRDLGRLQEGQKVFMNGASGGVGVFAIQLAKAMGAIVHASCSYRNVDLLRSLGADLVVDYTREDVRELETRYDVFFDIYGNQSFPRSRHLLTAHGRHITTIPSPKNYRRQWLSRFFKRTTQVVLVASHTHDLDELANYVQTGKLRPVIDRRYPFEQAVDAFDYLDTRRAKGKIVLQIEKE